MTADLILAKLLDRIGDRTASKAEEHKINGKKLEEEGKTDWAAHEYMIATTILEIAMVFKGLAIEELGGVPT